MSSLIFLQSLETVTPQCKWLQTLVVVVPLDFDQCGDTVFSPLVFLWDLDHSS